MATKRPYVVKIKTHRGWTNRVTGAKYRKGKTYEKRFGDKSVKALRIWHQDKDYVKKAPYKLISIRKKPVKR